MSWNLNELPIHHPVTVTVHWVTRDLFKFWYRDRDPGINVWSLLAPSIVAPLQRNAQLRDLFKFGGELLQAHTENC